MKWVLVLFLCFSCFAWDDADSNNLSSIKNNTSLMNDKLGYIWQNLQSPSGNTNIYQNTEAIKDRSVSMSISLQQLYNGIAHYNDTGYPDLGQGGLSKAGDSRSDVGNYGTYYNSVIGINHIDTPQEENTAFMNYIKSFSSYLYQTSNDSPNDFLSYPDKFSFVEPIAKVLDEETTDFQPDTLKNVQGMQKINSVNTFVDEILTDIAKNPNESNFNSDFLVGGSNFADTTFHIDLSSLGQLWVNLANKYGGGSGSSPAAKGSVITTNPFRDWVFDLRLRPQQGDYLYSIYTWWNSDQPLPRAIRYTLQALVYAYTFYYCFTYTKELWSK